MQYFVILLVALLMLADYFLTLVGSRLSRASGYSQIFSSSGYELNPVWQKDIAADRRFNPRHLVLVLAATAIIGLGTWLLGESPLTRRFWELAMGAVLAIELTLLGRHLNNILLFQYIHSHPDQLQGRVQIDYRLSLKISEFQLVTSLLPLLLIAVVKPSFFTLGTVCGVLLIVLVHGIWSLRASRRLSKPANAEGRSSGA